MLKLILFITFLCYGNTWAQNTNYSIHGPTKHQVSTKSEILKLLKTKGFTKNINFWYTITKGINLINETELKRSNPPQEIYLPLRKPLAVTSFKSPKQRLCNIVPRSKLSPKLSRESKVYLKYIELITKRNKKLKKGSNIIGTLKSDLFKYKNLKQTSRLVLAENRVKDLKLSRDTNIKLPLCLNRNILSSLIFLTKQSRKKNTAKKRETKPSKSMDINKTSSNNKYNLKFNNQLYLSYGQLALELSTVKSTANILRVGFSKDFQLSSVFYLGLALGADYYSGINTSTTSGEQTGGSSINPNYSFAIKTKFEKWSFSGSYTSNNYLLLKNTGSTIKLESTPITRLGANISWQFFKRLGLSLSYGMVNGADDSNVAGTEYSISAPIFLTERLILSPLIYASSITSGVDKLENDSSVVLVSLGYLF